MSDRTDRTHQLVLQEINHAKDIGDLRQQKAPLEDQCGDPNHPRDVGPAGTSIEAEAEGHPS